jgi:hypothetical protein
MKMSDKVRLMLAAPPIADKNREPITELKAEIIKTSALTQQIFCEVAS